MYNITHDDYTFMDGDNQGFWVIKLLTGDYADTMYHYGQVRIVDVEPDAGSGDSFGKLEFSYSLMESPLDLELLQQSPEFNNYIGAVLQHIIEDAFVKGDYKIGDKDGKPGNDDTEELDQF